jgi:hypothetical protein
MGITLYRIFAVLSLAVTSGCSQAHAVQRNEVADGAVVVPAPLQAAVIRQTWGGSAPVEPRPPWTATTGLADPPVDLRKGITGVVAHVPTGFDATQPIHLVLFFHGSGECVAQLALSGDVVCLPGTAPRKGAGLVSRHDDAATNTVFVAPQFILWGGGTPGKMLEPGYFQSFVEELLHDTLAPGLGGPRTLDDLADITIVAHSAGHMPLVPILEQHALDDKIKNVVLLDSLYDGRVGTYVRWVERGMAAGRDPKLVAIYGEWGWNPWTGRTIASRVEAIAAGSTVIDPPGSLQDAIRSHQVTVAKWNVNHRRMIVLTMSKVLAALGLPARAMYPPRTPTGAVPAPGTLMVGTRVVGKLDNGDASLENGALFDDYALDLDAGEQIDLDLRGGYSKTEPGGILDVFLEVLQDGQSLAQDDDGSGGFDAHLLWTAPDKGQYIVRVSTSGAGRKRGPYTLWAR